MQTQNVLFNIWPKNYCGIYVDWIYFCFGMRMQSRIHVILITTLWCLTEYNIESWVFTQSVFPSLFTKFEPLVCVWHVWMLLGKHRRSSRLRRWHTTLALAAISAWMSTMSSENLSNTAFCVSTWKVPLFALTISALWYTQQLKHRVNTTCDFWTAS